LKRGTCYGGIEKRKFSIQDVKTVERKKRVPLKENDSSSSSAVGEVVELGALDIYVMPRGDCGTNGQTMSSKMGKLLRFKKIQFKNERAILRIGRNTYSKGCKIVRK
jgi:hypothetical protein